MPASSLIQNFRWFSMSLITSSTNLSISNSRPLRQAFVTNLLIVLSSYLQVTVTVTLHGLYELCSVPEPVVYRLQEPLKGTNRHYSAWTLKFRWFGSSQKAMESGISRTSLLIRRQAAGEK